MDNQLDRGEDIGKEKNYKVILEKKLGAPRNSIPGLSRHGVSVGLDLPSRLYRLAHRVSNPRRHNLRE